MVLVDTSVWISHFRDGNAELAKLLNNGKALCHPLIVGELACGNLKDKELILSFLQQLPVSIEAEHYEVLSFIENNLDFQSKLYLLGSCQPLIVLI